MQISLSYILLAVILLFSACKPALEMASIGSPDGTIKLVLELDNGFPHYSIFVDEQVLVLASGLGFNFRGAQNLNGPFKLVHSSVSEIKEQWSPVWGQEKQIHSHSFQGKYELEEIKFPNRQLNLYFRVFDDGAAFRYEIPEQTGLDSLFITKELTEFNFASDGRAWWNEGSYLFDTPEQLYHQTSLSDIDSANTPMTYINHENLYVSVHEANLTDYAGMTLQRDKQDSLKFHSALVPWPDGDKVKASVPLVTPWRTILVGRTAADLLRSRMILNLNEPTAMSDVSWIKPMKYIGIWWGMHINKYTWTQGERHGATTENAKDYIDFAAENNLQGVLVEGWNQGWEEWGQEDALNLTTPYDDFDIQAVTDYAAQRGITFIGHHETTANVQSYEQQMEAAFDYYAQLGIRAVKTGYVGSIKPAGQFHYGQWMVRHFRKVIQTAARYNISINVHEPIKSTGIERTWPNMMTREGGRGLEYNAWSQGNPPNHTTILPFTRLLAGPMDYTPGIFDLTFDRYKLENRVHTTLTKQLALMVVLYSPLQMAADLIENYVDQPAFQFIRDLKTDWDKTIYLEAEIGEKIALARRQGDEWFLGAITNEKERKIAIPLSKILETDMVAECYVDASTTDWESNPYPILIRTYHASKNDTLEAYLAAGGGLAIRFRPLATNDSNLPRITQLFDDQLH